MSVQEQNRQAVIDYIMGGARPACTKLGVEVEHFVISEDGEPIAYFPHEGYIGVYDVLCHLRSAYPTELLNGKGRLLGLAGPDGSITLEPAAQLEFSIAPFEDVPSVMAAYERFRALVDPFLAEHGCRLEAGGYHPTRKAFDLELIPKKRYKFMDRFFTEIGSKGHRMMRASASTQVSVDFSDEADAIRKMRVANALAPILAAIADNAPVYEGEPNGMPITRFNLWREVDPARCGAVPGLFEEGYGVAQYVDWLFRTRPIFVTRPAADEPDGAALRYDDGKLASELYADAPMTEEDVEHLLSMFWPDVRLKRFVEIRPADCLPREYVGGYAALVKGIFYSEDALAAVEERLGVRDGVWPLSGKSVDDAVEQIRQQGFAGLVYGHTLSSWVDFLFHVASSSLDAQEQGYLARLKDFATTKEFWG